jgi:hypothetical protein
MNDEDKHWKNRVWLGGRRIVSLVQRQECQTQNPNFATMLTN